MVIFVTMALSYGVHPGEADATTIAGKYVEVNYDEYGLPFEPDLPQGIRGYIGSTPAWYEFTFFDTTGTTSDIDPFVAMSFYYERGGTPYEYAGYANDTSSAAEVDWTIPTETDLSTASMNSISWTWTAGDLEITKTESWDIDGYAIFVHFAVTNTSGSRLKNFSYLQLLDPADTRSSASTTNTRNDVMDLDGDGLDEWAQALGRSTTTSTNNRTIGYGFCDPSSQQVAFKDGVDVYISDVEATGFETDPGGSSSNTQITYLYSDPSSIEAGDTVMFGMIVAMGTNSAGAQSAYTGALENCYDLDGDGYENDLGAGDDCNDSNAEVSPDADEIWYDGYDQDCGKDDDYDQDGDGYVPDEYEGLKTYNTGTETAISGTGVAPAGDCDDTDEDVYPGADEEWYDGIDQDCQGDNDYDADTDGYVEDEYEGLPTYDPGTGDVVDDGTGTEPGDCDDSNGDIYAGAEEIWYDGFDEDCQGDSDFDQDGDGYVPDEYEGEPTYDPGTGEVVEDGELPAGDCDDTDEDINPEADEVWYDGVDGDCQNDDDYDQDGDGYVPEEYEGLPTYTTDGDLIEGSGELESGDCDDLNAETNPESEEIWYDGLDEDCQGDDDYDQDGDGYVPDEYEGLPTTDTDGNEIPGTGELEGGDCDDEDEDVHPDVDETWYDGVDSDCGEDDDYDQDGDGFVPDEYVGLPTYSPDGDEVDGTGEADGNDCNDTDESINPAGDETWYDGIDSDCGGDDDYDQDADGRVYAAYQGLPTSTSSTDPGSAVVAGTGEAPGGECDDTNPDVPNDVPCAEEVKPSGGCGCTNTASSSPPQGLAWFVIAATARRRQPRKRTEPRGMAIPIILLTWSLRFPDARAGYGDDASGARSHLEFDLFTWIAVSYAGADNVLISDTTAEGACSIDSLPPWALEPGTPPYLDDEADERAEERLAEVESTCDTDDDFCILNSDELHFTVGLTASTFSSQSLLSHYLLCDESLSKVLLGVEGAPLGLAIRMATPGSDDDLAEGATEDTESSWLISVDRTGAGIRVPYAPFRSGICSEASRTCHGVWFGATNADSTPVILQVTDGVNTINMSASICDTSPILFELVAPGYPVATSSSFVPGRGCEPYWFVWETSDGGRGTFPEAGALVGEDCDLPEAPWIERPIPRAFFCGVADLSSVLTCALPSLILVTVRRKHPMHNAGQ